MTLPKPHPILADARALATSAQRPKGPPHLGMPMPTCAGGTGVDLLVWMAELAHEDATSGPR